MEWVARAVGVFYALAGFVVLRAARTGRVLDGAIEGRTPEVVAERRSTAFGLTIAWLTLLSGLALIALSRFAAPLFVLSGLAQALFLLWAGRALPPEDALGARGRRQTTNALLVYLAATAFVIWLHTRGTLG